MTVCFQITARRHAGLLLFYCEPSSHGGRLSFNVLIFTIENLAMPIDRNIERTRAYLTILPGEKSNVFM